MTTWLAIDEAARDLGITTDELRMLVLERGLSRREDPRGIYALRRGDLAGLFLAMQRRKEISPRA